MKLHELFCLLFNLTPPCARLLASKLTEAGSNNVMEMLRNLKGDRIGVGSLPVQDWINHTDPEVGRATREKASRLISMLPEYMVKHPGLSQEEAMKRLVHREVSCQRSMRTFVTLTNADTDSTFEESFLVSAVSAVSSDSEPSDLESDSDDGFVVLGQEEEQEDQEQEDQGHEVSRLNAASTYCRLVQQRAK